MFIGKTNGSSCRKSRPKPLIQPIQAREGKLTKNIDPAPQMRIVFFRDPFGVSLTHASGARASICDAGPRVRASCSPGHLSPCIGGGCTPDWPPRVAAVQVTLAVSRVNTTIPPDQARRRPGRPCPHPRRPRAGRPGWPPPCRPASGASSAAWSVCSSMARAGTAATGSGGVTGAAGAAAACGALFTARARCSRRREAWSIFFVSNFFKEQFGVSLSGQVCRKQIWAASD